MAKYSDLFCLVLFLCLIISRGEAAVLEISVQEATALAIENNLDFRLLTLDLKEAKADLERAQIVGEEELLSEAEEVLTQLEKRYAAEKQNLINQVRGAYQELLESETSLVNWQKALERSKEQLRIDQSKFEAGLLSTLDIQRAENSLINAENNYAAAVVNLETKKMEFNRLLGLDLKQELVLTEQLMLDFLPFDFVLEECYNLALQVDNTVLRAKEELLKAEEAVSLAQSPFVPRVELERAQTALAKASIGVEQAELTLYFKVRSEYYNLLQQVQALEAKERTIKLESQNLKAEESKYAAGVLSNAQIVAQQDKLAKLEQEYSTELLQYSLARLRFLQMLGLDGDGWGEGNVD